MAIYMVGVHKNGNEISGFRMLSVDNDNNTEIKDVNYNMTLNTLQSGLVNIHNIKLENNKIKGSNGSLDRFGTVGKTQSLVILKEIQDEKGNSIGYFCSDTNGNTKKLSENDVITFAEKIGIANGKVVPSGNNERHISSIEGTYERMNMPTKPSSAPQNTQPVQQTQPQQAAQTQPVQQNNNTNTTAEVESANMKEARKLIAEMSKHPDYKKSFAYKIDTTINKYNNCSDKQLNILKREYKKLLGEQDNKQTKPVENNKQQTPVNQTQVNAPVETKPASVPVSQTPVNTPISTPSNNITTNSTTNDNKPVEQKPETSEQKPKREYDKIVIAKPKTDMDEVLVYQIMKNGQVYVKGLNKNCTETTIVIPETTVLNGKTYNITGINVSAFENTRIKEIKTSKNINDIGQAAFRNIPTLRYADLSESKHQHIPMNLFNGCSNLLQVNVGKYVQRIHEAAFYECKYLQTIELPDTTDTIARNAFYGCERLEDVKHSVKFINDSAFRNCTKLAEFDFSTVNIIGSYAFRNTGFKHLVIPGNITTVGNKAFADCLLLKEVDLQEGIQELGEYCFAKSNYDDVRRQYRQEIPYNKLEEIRTPKSIISVLAGAFHHVGLVKVYTGSTCESHCIGFNIPYERIDSSNKDNATTVRIKSEIMDNNPIETLYSVLETEVDNASNPDFEMNTSKLINVPFSDEQLNALNLYRTNTVIEPHIKFKAMVNYLQDVADMFQKPLTHPVLRLQNTFYVEPQQLFNDGCNRIYKITYRIMDTLDEGSFILVMTNNCLRYIAECTVYTDMELENTFENNQTIPVDKFLHAGDTIGKQGTISGHSSILTLQDSFKRVNVGEMLLHRLKDHGITFKTTKRDSILYLPACNVALNMHDGRIWDRPGVISKDTKDCINLVNIMSYEEMVKILRNTKKASFNATKLFDDLSQMSEREVRLRTTSIDTIEDEKEAQLFQVSKQFRQIIDNARLNEVDITPNLVTPELFDEISRSYWMISKDVQWLNNTGTKSLNKMNEYTIGKYKLIEYKSNQIVKFSNPYMNGQKGAYVFTLMQGSNIIGVYASRYAMDDLVRKLYYLTDMSRVPENEPIPELMQSAEIIDKVHPSLFYVFYDVLQSKNGWGLQSILSNYNFHAAFHISMYKPTGVFYLTMDRITVLDKKEEGNKVKVTQAYRTMPLLPIGNMDRALMVATTTNTNAKGSKLLEELLAIMNIEEINDYNMRLGAGTPKTKMLEIREKYTKARQLVIDRVKDVNAYKQLIDDRAVYMLGTFHSGVLQREKDSIDFEEEINELDLEDVAAELNNMDLEYEDYEEDDFEDVELDNDDLSEYMEENEEIDLDDDEEEPEITEEEFIEVAKSQGITDINVAKAMYINFLARGV